jgi:hypothetical protein
MGSRSLYREFLGEKAWAPSAMRWMKKKTSTKFWTARMLAIIIVMIETYLLFSLSSPQISVHARLIAAAEAEKIDFVVTLHFRRDQKSGLLARLKLVYRST